MAYNITQLRISETEFRCIIESISKEVIDTSVQEFFTDTILYRTFNDSDVEQLYLRAKFSLLISNSSACLIWP